MQLPWEIFRAYDIRGRALGEDAPLTAPLAQAIGRAYGTMLRRESTATQCLIGGDHRVTTPALRTALIEGLRGAGIDVLDIGLAASPLAYWAAAQRDEAERPTAAAVVTASHNPPDQNGIKLVWPSTMPLLPDQIRGVAELIERGDFESGVGAIRDWDPIPEYLTDLTDLAGNRAGESSLMLVADPGNGVAALTGPAALGAGGATVHVINAELSSAPQHTADPQHAENMQQLQRAVIERSADLGIAWDGDGDRLGVVDARSRRATPDRILALLARAHLERHPGAPIHVDVKVSQAVIEDIRSRGGRPVLGPVGHSLGKHAMQAAGIDFGGEASSHYFQRVASLPPRTSPTTPCGQRARSSRSAAAASRARPRRWSSSSTRSPPGAPRPRCSCPAPMQRSSASRPKSPRHWAATTRSSRSTAPAPTARASSRAPGRSSAPPTPRRT